ncbi:HlyD family efflux transporter periplasmic adaptor subunit [Hydrogenophaga sp.]|uniref:HlyD family efflux transporter periplasmic adaptor subunit n=1 Tax=Hydrogenophaga sp. TaxID=1904254 RepID=UPI003D0D20CA
MTTSPDTPPTPGNPARRKALTGVAAAVLVAGIGYGAYWALVLNHFETTDNAYVQGNVVQITPQQAGTVVAINANDNDHVQAGQWLVRLDPTDARIALEQAEAQLAQTVREVRTLYANNRTQSAQIALREADLARAQSDLQRLQDDVARRQPLVASGAVGQEEFKHATAQLAAARSNAEAARAAVAAAREQLASSQSLTEGISVEQHPNVLRASARVREAYVALQRVELQAPVGGYVARRNVQLGQRLQAGAPLMSVIALDQVWVEANFKESQLKNLRIDQPVELTADVYGKNVVYHGRIEGLGAGTGAAFALLPAQNATGNWIKVVQRVPVRVRLDAKELADHPLRLGLSMEARVDVSQTNGRMLADAGATPVAVQTAVFEQDNREADARVRQLIAQHGGGPRTAATRHVKPAPPAATPSTTAAPAVALAR